MRQFDGLPVDVFAVGEAFEVVHPWLGHQFADFCFELPLGHLDGQAPWRLEDGWFGGCWPLEGGQGEGFGSCQTICRDFVKSRILFMDVFLYFSPFDLDAEDLNSRSPHKPSFESVHSNA